MRLQNILVVLGAAWFLGGCSITTLISQTPGQEPSDAVPGQAGISSLSADGAAIVFESNASNLLAGDPLCGTSPCASQIYQRIKGASHVTLVSIDPNGNPADGFSDNPSISASARFAGFTSTASDLPGGTGIRQAYVANLLDGSISLVSSDSFGNAGQAPSEAAKISADGKVAAFSSEATNLVPGDNNGSKDVFVKDRTSGTTTRVSVSAADPNQGGDGDSRAPQLAAYGRFLIFTSDATDLVNGDTNDDRDVFRFDRQTGQMLRVSLDASGQQIDGTSASMGISADGNRVLFISLTNSPGTTITIYVRDVAAGTTTEIATTLAPFTVGSISADGRYVAFTSDKDGLVPNDLDGEGDLFLHDLETGRTSLVSKFETRSLSPSISAYGDHVSFSNDNQIRRVRLPNRAPLTLTSGRFEANGHDATLSGTVNIQPKTFPGLASQGAALDFHIERLDPNTMLEVQGLGRFFDSPSESGDQALVCNAGGTECDVTLEPGVGSANIDLTAPTEGKVWTYDVEIDGADLGSYPPGDATFRIVTCVTGTDLCASGRFLFRAVGLALVHP